MRIVELQSPEKYLYVELFSVARIQQSGASKQAAFSLLLAKLSNVTAFFDIFEELRQKWWRVKFWW